MYGCSVQLAWLGMNFPTSPECWVGRTVDAKWPFLVIVHIQQQGEVSRAALLKAVHRVFRPGTKRRNIRGTCALAGPTWQASPHLPSHPRAADGCSSAAGTDLFSHLGFMPPVGLLGNQQEVILCGGVHKHMSVYLLPWGPLGSGSGSSKGCSARCHVHLAEVTTSSAKLARGNSCLPGAPAPQTKVQSLRLKHFDGKCCQALTVPGEAQVPFSFFSCGVGIPCMGTKCIINKNYQTIYEINKMSYTWPQWHDFASQGCWPSVGLCRRQVLAVLLQRFAQWRNGIFARQETIPGWFHSNPSSLGLNSPCKRSLSFNAVWFSV